MKKNELLTHRKTGEKYRYLRKAKINSIFEFWVVKRVQDNFETTIQKTLFNEGYERPSYLGESYGTNI